MGEKRKSTNRFRSLMWDYYYTNREVSRQNETARDEEKKNSGAEEKKKWTQNEKIYLAVIIVGIVLIVIKYFVL